MLSNAAFSAPTRTTLRETESGAHYDTEERNAARAAFFRNPEGRGFKGVLLCRSSLVWC